CILFFNDTATTEIYTLSLHDALPIWDSEVRRYLDQDTYSPYCNFRCATREIGRAHVELQSHLNLVCRLLLEKKRSASVCCLVAADRRFAVVLLVFILRSWVMGDYFVCFFFNDTAPTEIYPLSLPDALPI